jgi:hypothetical protein
MNVGKFLLGTALAVLAAHAALAAPEPPCGSWKNQPPPAPSDQREDDSGLAPPPKKPPVEPSRPIPDGTGTQDPDKRIK